MFHKVRKKVFTLLDDSTTIISNAKYETKHRKRLKIINPKQVIQRLSIVLHS